MIYFIILIAILLLTYIYDYREKTTGRTLWYIVIFVALVLLAGLRYRIGTDSIRYESYYQNVPMPWELKYNYFQKVRWEPGFVIFTSICRSISDDFTLFQIVHALIINSAVFLFFWKNTRHPFFAIFLYCFFSYIALNTEVLRESLAVAMFLFAWPFFKKSNFIVYYLFIVIGMFFHIGSSICLLCPLFVMPGVRYFFTYGKRTIFICLALIVIGFAVNKMFFNYVKLLSFSATMVDRATAYAKDELGTSTYNMMGVLGSLMKWAVYPMVAMYFLNKDSKRHLTTEENKEERYAQAMAIMSVYIACLTIVINLFHRFNSYFILFAILIVSQWTFTLLKVKKKRYRLGFVYWCLIFIPMLAFLIRAEFKDVGFSNRLKEYMSYYPYASRLDPQEDRNREAVFRYHKSW